MATDSAGSAARKPHGQQIAYLRKSFTYADNNTTIDVGTIPAGSLLVKPMSGVQVHVSFDGTSTILDIGPSTNTDLWMTDGSLATLTFVPLDEAVDMRVTSDTLVQAFVIVSASAPAAATGQADIVIAYIPTAD